MRTNPHNIHAPAKYVFIYQRFRLNRSEYGRSAVGDTEYSLFVGDLSPEVSDDMLLDFFRKRYKSVRVAKIVCDDNGYAKG